MNQIARFDKKKQKNIIPEAYSNIYKGLPCANKEDKSIKVSESEKPKFENVIGKSNKADAKIAGITPAVLIFNGKCDDSPP